jgi:succinate dehydrogenase / fumarate reductase cytochrome b subunit
MHPRPLSPHLQIYRPQITSVLSILHRITGVALVAGLIVLIATLFTLSCCEESYNDVISLLQLSQFLYWRWLLIFSLHYHALNGIRHLFWDTVHGFNIKFVSITGWIVIILSFLATAILYIYAHHLT